MYKIYVNGVLLYASENFTEFLALYQKSVKKYGWDAVSPECTNPDRLTINLKINWED